MPLFRQPSGAQGPPGPAGPTIDVKDGVTTVINVDTVDFTAGATVTDGGGGVAEVAVSGGSQTLAEVTVELDSTDILSLHDGIELGPTPEADEMVVPAAASLAFSAGATPYSGGTIILTTLAAFNDTPGSLAWGEFGITLDSEESGATLMQAIDQIKGSAAFVAGQRLCLATSATPTDGDGTAIVTVWYAIVTGPTDPAP